MGIQDPMSRDSDVTDQNEVQTTKEKDFEWETMPEEENVDSMYLKLDLISVFLR